MSYPTLLSNLYYERSKLFQKRRSHGLVVQYPSDVRRTRVRFSVGLLRQYEWQIFLSYLLSFGDQWTFRGSSLPLETIIVPLSLYVYSQIARSFCNLRLFSTIQPSRSSLVSGYRLRMVW